MSYEIRTFNRLGNNHKMQSVRLQLTSRGMPQGVSNVQQSVITFVEIIDINDKLEWWGKFYSEYLGRPLNADEVCMDNPGDYYIIIGRGCVYETVGFINVLNYTPGMSEDDICLAVIYVDQKYRGNGIYDSILNCGLIRGVYVGYNTYNKYKNYYVNNGFIEKSQCCFDLLLVKK